MMIINHINPKCKSSRFCLPHNDTEDVNYDIDAMLDYIKEIELKLEHIGVHDHYLEKIDEREIGMDQKAYFFMCRECGEKKEIVFPQ